ncbi:phosphotransferase enzyme family protein [Hypoxylon cercidicola]|nr:phosphotransferase enzyme family protein [Hypoxylon cercidicola]
MAGRVRHPIDTVALERYISEHVPEIKVPLDVKQFGFGQSNPTYQLTAADGARYVLRKKPAGALLSPAAHKVEREHRVIAALSRFPSVRVPVPRPYGLCEDPSVLGTPFYVMSYVRGRIFEDPAMPTASSPAERAALWRAAAEALAALHRVDADAAGLGSFGGGGRGKGGGGGGGGFYARQLATWRAICGAQAAARDAATREPVGAVPHMAELVAFFGDEARRPRDRAALVHGDYKIDNVVFEAAAPRVAGILDWEMSTVGHPLSDLANLLHPFVSAELSAPSSSSPSSPSPPGASPDAEAEAEAVAAISHPSFLPDATPGLPTPAEVIAWYAAAAGWTPTPDEVAWACAFSVFRLAAICQGIAARVATRQASSASARKHAAALKPLGEFAWVLVRREVEKRGEGTEKGAAAKL